MNIPSCLFEVRTGRCAQWRCSVRARFDMATGETFQLSDFYLIDEAKLGRLADDNLPPLFRSGALGLAYLHLASLGNMRKLLDRVSVHAPGYAALSRHTFCSGCRFHWKVGVYNETVRFLYATSAGVAT